MILATTYIFVSPLLFALYLNDLQDHLAEAYNGPYTSCSLIQYMVQDGDTVIYLKLFTILYADDTVIFAESRQKLQAALHGMHRFCTLWKLYINSVKTKVVVYGSKNSNHEPDFTLGGHTSTAVSEYVYLGICFPCNNNLGKSIVSLRQTTRAMFALINKIKAAWT